MNEIWVGIENGDNIGFELSLRKVKLFHSKKEVEEWIEKRKKKACIEKIGLKWVKKEHIEFVDICWVWEGENYDEYGELIGKKLA